MADSTQTTPTVTLTRAEGRRIAEVCDGDGHSIVSAAAFAEVNPAFVAQLVRRHHSDGSDPKSTIFKDGQALLYVDGVYTLDILWGAVRPLGLRSPAEMLMGRGFQARSLCKTLLGEDGGVDGR